MPTDLVRRYQVAALSIEMRGCGSYSVEARSIEAYTKPH
jgi:hypothetical protein